MLKVWPLISLLLISACHSPVVGPAPVQNRVNAASRTRETLWSPRVQALLQAPDTEVDPPEVRGQEQAQLPGTYYIQAHSYLFRTLDQGQSTVEAILNHDGQTRAAAIVAHWRDLLGENALWPDQETTTCKDCRFPSLEHALLKNGRGWFGRLSAADKFNEYYQRAREAWQHSLPPDHPAQATSWRWLARASHFLQDVTIPFHTVSLLRPAQALYHNRFEETCDERFRDYHPLRNHDPMGVWIAQGPYPPDKTWGLYFPAGTSGTKLVEYNAGVAREFYRLVRGRNDEKAGNWEIARSAMIPLAAKTTAGVIVMFLEENGALR
jgi:hypothetical protein